MSVQCSNKKSKEEKMNPLDKLIGLFEELYDTVEDFPAKQLGYSPYYRIEIQRTGYDLWKIIDDLKEMKEVMERE
jgi:hypothetical protein